MATYKNLFIDQGSDFSFSVDLEPTIGSLDLNGYSARGQIKKAYASTDSTDFSLTLNVSDKEIVASLSASQTSALKAGRYVYDIEIYSGSLVTRVIEGQIEITPRVTTV